MKKHSERIHVDEALARIDAEVSVGPAGRVALEDAAGCVLAEAVTAPADQPALDHSAIDGFALREGSPAGEYAVVGEWFPGREPAAEAPRAGQACRVYTGTPLPPGCGLVMVEDAEVEDTELRICVDASTERIRRRGGALRAGTVLLEGGMRIGPGEVAVLASVGVVNPVVYRPPRVLHLTTGSEIVSPGSVAAPWEIRNSNAPLIQSLVESHRLGEVRKGHVDESVRGLVGMVEAADSFDFLFLSGGSSVGRYDRSAQALREMGFEILFHRVQSRPGKPLLFARRGNQWAFGIPGNPVAHFVVFHLFLHRALCRFMGVTGRSFVSARLSEDLESSGDGRETFWPAQLRLSGAVLEASPRPWAHSGDVAALRGIDALIRFPGPVEGKQGDLVPVLPCFPESPASP